MAKKPCVHSEHVAFSLKGRGISLDLSIPRIMGILNVTPDSFFDGGSHQKRADAVKKALQMVKEGADIIDVGGESTRPGADAVSVDEEMDRVIPVIEALRREIDTPLSVDTYKSRVAAEAVAVGANFINDISGLQFDPDMADVVSSCGAGLFLMHTRGGPQEMQKHTDYGDIIQEIRSFFRQQMEKALLGGIEKEKIAIDPGVGFAKDIEGNLTILRHLGELKTLGVPILLGTSRKSFIGTILGKPDPRERLYGSIATVALGVQAGARIFRVHDVEASRDAAMTAWAICAQGNQENQYLSGGVK